MSRVVMEKMRQKRWMWKKGGTGNRGKWREKKRGLSEQPKEKKRGKKGLMWGVGKREKQEKGDRTGTRCGFVVGFIQIFYLEFDLKLMSY